MQKRVAKQSNASLLLQQAMPECTYKSASKSKKILTKFSNHLKYLWVCFFESWAWLFYLFLRCLVFLLLHKVVFLYFIYIVATYVVVNFFIGEGCDC